MKLVSYIYKSIGSSVYKSEVFYIFGTTLNILLCQSGTYEFTFELTRYHTVTGQHVGSDFTRAFAWDSFLQWFCIR